MAAEAQLSAALAREMEAAETEARATAAEDRDRLGRGGYPYRRHSYDTVWSLLGSTPLLISLSATEHRYRGGAHGSLELAALLWDRAGGRKVDAAAALGEPALARLTPRYCDALNAERSERRGEPVTPDPSDLFAACPPLTELPLAPADEDGDGRFDTLHVLIAPYIAGPWVEGPYVIEVRLETEDLADVAAAWRPAFEAADDASPVPNEPDEVR